MAEAPTTDVEQLSEPGADPAAVPTDASVDTGESLALAHRLIDVLVDRQAEDVVLLDLSALAAFTDYFVIATATSERQLRTLIDAVMKAVPGLGRAEQEGDAAGGWVLLDCSGVVVHLFTLERRAYYDLEGLWSRAQQVVRIQ